jgi:hypothetical protein
MRETIAYWVTLILGIALLAMQLYKYATNSLPLTLEEFIVTSVAVILIFSPKLIINVFKSKYGK